MHTILYTGLECPKEYHTRTDVHLIHCPLIEVVPRPYAQISDALSHLQKATHVIVTSKTAVYCLKPYLFLASKAQFLSVGKATTSTLENLGIHDILTAESECQEGLISLISAQPLQSPFFFWGHSALSRPLLKEFINKSAVPHIAFVLYDTRFKEPSLPISLDNIDEIVFSSPSTVEAFCHFFGSLPQNKKLSAKGQVTEQAIKSKLLK